MLVSLRSPCDVFESGLLLQVGEGKKIPSGMCCGSGLMQVVEEKEKKIPVEIESFKLDFHLGGRIVNNCHYKSSFKGSIYDGLFNIMPPKWKLSLRDSISTGHNANGIWQ